MTFIKTNIGSHLRGLTTNREAQPPTLGTIAESPHKKAPS